MFTVRLDKDLEKKILQASRQNNCNKSEIVKKSLHMYFFNQPPSSTPYDLGHDLFGKQAASKSHKQKTLKDRLKRKIYEKNFS